MKGKNILVFGSTGQVGKNLIRKLTKNNQLLAFKHNGFWACMDTIREKKELNKIWKSKQKAWKIWL